MTTPCAAATCHRTLNDAELDAGQRICSPCVSTIRTWMVEEIPNQLIVLEGSLQRETTGQPSSRGTRTAPLPGREDVLNLLGPSAWTAVRDEHGDQEGAVPIVGVLTGWVRLVCEERRWDGPETVTAQALAAWLGRDCVLDWACRRGWAGEMRDELAGLMRTVRAITRVRSQRRPVGQPCPRCDSLTLVETDWEVYVECGTCESRFTRGELRLGAALTVAALDVA